MRDLKINFFTESSPDSCTHHLSLSPLSESNQLVATLNTVADHLSVLLFLCLIFHNLQLAGASIVVWWQWRRSKKGSHFTLSGSENEQQNRSNPFTEWKAAGHSILSSWLPLSLSFYLSAKANFRFDGILSPIL